MKTVKDWINRLTKQDGIYLPKERLIQEQNPDKYKMKYLKYKSKYLQNKNITQNLLQNKDNFLQKGGNFKKLIRRYITEALCIYNSIVNAEHGENILFYITGSVAVSIYIYEYINGIREISDEQMERLKEFYEKVKPNDIDIFWIAEPSSIMPEESLFASLIYEIQQKFASIATEVDSSVKISLVPKPLKFSRKVPKGKNCNDIQEELLILNSHYTDIPVDNSTIFYKCNDRESIYDKIDFKRSEDNPSILNLLIFGSNVSILGLSDLIKSYETYSRPTDKIKLIILTFIKKHLPESYDGNKMFDDED